MIQRSGGHAVAQSMSNEKADIVIAWLADGNVLVHFDATRSDVAVPARLRNRESCIFEFGLHMPIPIPDLKVDQAGVAATLSFPGLAPKRCFVPWAAVFCVSQVSTTRVKVWLNDAPGDVQRAILNRAGEAANRKLQRSRLKLVK